MGKLDCSEERLSLSLFLQQHPDSELLLEITKVLPHESMSETILLVGNVTIYHKDFENKKTKFFGKLRFKDNYPIDNSLLIEENIYSSIINKLASLDITPNVITYITTINIPNFRHYIHFKFPQFFGEISKQIQELHDKVPSLDFENATLVLLELGEGYTLHKMMNMINFDDLNKIIFQTLYTLYNFALIGLLHNDLHTGNVFIEILDYPIDLIYFTDEDTYFTIKTRYIAKIFDFDLSFYCEPSAKDCLENTRVNNLDDIGLRNNKIVLNKNDKFDLFLFLCTLYKSDIDQKIKDNIIRKIITVEKLLDYNWEFACRLSNITYKKNNPTHAYNTGTYVPTSEQIINFSNIFGGEIFGEYKHSLQEEGFPFSKSECHIYISQNVNAEKVMENITNEQEKLERPETPEAGLWFL